MMQGTYIKALRNRLGLSQAKFGFLLNVHEDTVGRWETGKIEISQCVERVILLIEEVPDEVIPLLSRRSEPIFGEGVSVGGFISDLQENLGMTNDALSALTGIYDGAQISKWRSGKIRPSECQELIIWLLGYYSSRDPGRWPLALQLIPESKLTVITPERILGLRKNFLMTQRQLANLLHVHEGTIPIWERGHGSPGWCANLLLRLLEMFPGETSDLLERIPRSDWELTNEKAILIRLGLGLTQRELAGALGVNIGVIVDRENENTRTASRTMERMDCVRFLYQLMEAYPSEMLELIRSIPRKTALPIP